MRKFWHITLFIATLFLSATAPSGYAQTETDYPPLSAYLMPETDEIAAGVEAAYATGQLPRRDGVSFAYMWSAGQYLFPGVGAWHPHLMVFAPYYDNAMVGGNEFGSPLPR